MIRNAQRQRLLIIHASRGQGEPTPNQSRRSGQNKANPQTNKKKGGSEGRRRRQQSPSNSGPPLTFATLIETKIGPSPSLRGGTRGTKIRHCCWLVFLFNGSFARSRERRGRGREGRQQRLCRFIHKKATVNCSTCSKYSKPLSLLQSMILAKVFLCGYSYTRNAPLRVRTPVST